MFARSDFGSPQKPPPPLENRMLGGLILLICVVILVVMVVTLDAAVFVPYNAAHAPTLTWEAQHTPRPTRTRAPRGTATPRIGNPNDQSAQNELAD